MAKGGLRLCGQNDFIENGFLEAGLPKLCLCVYLQYKHYLLWTLGLMQILYLIDSVNN